MSNRIKGKKTQEFKSIGLFHLRGIMHRSPTFTHCNTSKFKQTFFEKITLKF